MSQPVLFIAHGAPMLADDAVWVKELRAWAGKLGKPKAILVVSAHWEARPVTLGATRTVPLIYDFYGFPQKYYEVTYPAPGAPWLADRVRGLLSAAGLPTLDEPGRGLDHGAYVPLQAMYPDADVPILQISLPSLNPAEVFAVGRALAPLRAEGVLLVGSGFLVHNLRETRSGGPQGWATDFDAWIADTLGRRDHDALLDFERRAPAVKRAHPRTEHFVPVIFSAGAAVDDPTPTFPIAGYWLGSFSKRSVQYGKNPQ